ncbi:MAG: hypothetical protein R3A10_00675 [Caldilineaceae bacterium]
MAKSGALSRDMPPSASASTTRVRERHPRHPHQLGDQREAWDYLIGQPATFGCATLGDEDGGFEHKIAHLGCRCILFRDA